MESACIFDDSRGSLLQEPKSLAARPQLFRESTGVVRGRNAAPTGLASSDSGLETVKSVG
jgi:hypothetical protein